MNDKSKLRVAIAAAGTGGHVFPALNLAKHLMQHEDAKVLWFGADDISKKKALQFHIEHVALRVSGFKAVGWWRKLTALWFSLTAMFRAFYYLKRFKPDVLIGFGGFVTVPVGFAAKIAGVPVFIHEQNRVPGLANRVLAFLSKEIWLTFPGIFDRWQKKCVWTGVPHQCLAQTFSAREFNTPRRILVLGGSLGAKPLNEKIPTVLAKVKAHFPLDIRHQTGSKDVEAVKKSYQINHLNADVISFIEDMPSAYEWADVIISRAGALSLAEITASRRPAIVIPYPQSADNHQEKNADFFEKAGTLIKINQDCIGLELESRLLALLQDELARRSMAQAMERLGGLNTLELMTKRIRETI